MGVVDFLDKGADAAVVVEVGLGLASSALSVFINALQLTAAAL